MKTERKIIRNIGWVSVVLNLSAIFFHFLSASFIKLLWGEPTSCFRGDVCADNYGTEAIWLSVVTIIISVIVIVIWVESGEKS